MKSKLKATHIKEVEGSDYLQNPGDFYIRVLNIATQTGELMPTKIRAIIMECPFCGRDMASVASHRITEGNPWWRRICGLPTVVSVMPMLQCPYNQAHKFSIKNGKVRRVK